MYLALEKLMKFEILLTFKYIPIIDICFVICRASQKKYPLLTEQENNAINIRTFQFTATFVDLQFKWTCLTV